MKTIELEVYSSPFFFAGSSYNSMNLNNSNPVLQCSNLFTPFISNYLIWQNHSISNTSNDPT